MRAASSCRLMGGQERRARAALLVIMRRSRTSPSAARCERQLACARHGINGACDLRISVVEDLRRCSITISRRQHVVTHLSLGEGPRFIELIGGHFETRFVGCKLFQLAEERIGYGIIFVREIVVKVDAALNLVFLKTGPTTRRHFERSEEHTSELP